MKESAVLVIVTCLLAGSLIGYSLGTLASAGDTSNKQNQISTLEQEFLALQSSIAGSDGGSTVNSGSNLTVAQIYAEVKDSVVVVRGFVIQYDIFGRPYILKFRGLG